MATLYFNGAVDNDWQTIGNWWMDDAFTTQATSLPTSADDVVVSANIYLNSDSEPTVTNLTVSGSWVRVAIDLTVTGMATFNVQSYNLGTLNGNCTFNGSSWNSGPLGTINGDATFNDSSYNYKTVNGNATFNDSSYNDPIESTVTGDATFNDGSYNGGTVGGNATFNDGSYNGGTVGGNATFTESAYSVNPVGTVAGTVTFSSETPVSFTLGGSYYWNGNSSNWVFATAGQNWTFNDSAVNGDTVNGNATFNDDSYNGVFGSVFGVARFNRFTAVGGAVTDTVGQGTGYVTGGIQDSQGNPVTLWRMIWGLIGRIACDAEFIGTGGCSAGTCDGAVTFSDESHCEGLSCSAVPVFRGQSTCRYTPADWLGPARINVFNNDQGAYFEESSRVGRFQEYSGAMPRNRTTYPIQRGVNGSSILGIV